MFDTVVVDTAAAALLLIRRGLLLRCRRLLLIYRRLLLILLRCLLILQWVLLSRLLRTVMVAAETAAAADTVPMWEEVAVPAIALPAAKTVVAEAYSFAAVADSLVAGADSLVAGVVDSSAAGEANSFAEQAIEILAARHRLQYQRCIPGPFAPGM